MPLDFSALSAQMDRIESSKDATSILLKTLFDEFESHKHDPAAVQALVDRGRKVADDLAASVATYTPGADQPADGGTDQPAEGGGDSTVVDPS